MTAIDTTQESRKLAANQTAVEMAYKTTKEAFDYFVKTDYPNIKPKSPELRMYVFRFGQDKLSEEKMSEILIEHGYKVSKYRQVPEIWDVDEKM